MTTRQPAAGPTTRTLLTQPADADRLDDQGRRIYTALAYAYNAVDRHGSTIRQGGWSNLGEPVPLQLWHDGHQWPIGQVTATWEDERGLWADLVFDEAEELAQKAQGKLDRGFMTAVSVGFNPHYDPETSNPTYHKELHGESDVYEYVAQELLELSLVNVGSSRTARVVRDFAAAAGIDEAEARAELADLEDDTDTDTVEARIAPTSNGDGTKAMVALMLDPDTASVLAVDGGEPAEQLHITLAYLGDADDVDTDATVAAVTAALSGAGPVAGETTGAGVFYGADADAPHTLIALVSIPGLEMLRGLVSGAVGDMSAHGFTPHITLGVIEPGDAHPTVPATQLVFGAVSVKVGDTVTNIELGTAPDEDETVTDTDEDTSRRDTSDASARDLLDSVDGSATVDSEERADLTSWSWRGSRTLR